MEGREGGREEGRKRERGEQARERGSEGGREGGRDGGGEGGREKNIKRLGRHSFGSNKLLIVVPKLNTDNSVFLEH